MCLRRSTQLIVKLQHMPRLSVKREQVQDMEGKQREKAERLRFGRFFYRFPNGESGADVYDRMTIFEDHMIRDINAGRWVIMPASCSSAQCMASCAFQASARALVCCLQVLFSCFRPVRPAAHHAASQQACAHMPAPSVSTCTCWRSCCAMSRCEVADASLWAEVLTPLPVACRYSQRTSLVLVTHGLALRVFLMRWFHWSVDQFMQVFNPPNAEVRPLLLCLQSPGMGCCD